MRRLTITPIILMSIILVASNIPMHTSAFPEYSSKFVATYPQTKETKLSSCDTCHATLQKPNAYGEDYAKYNHDFRVVENMDSDGDGYSNIQEINAFTYPGRESDYPKPPIQTSPMTSTTVKQVAVSEYQGSEACGLCHKGQLESWKKSKHAIAFSDSSFQLQWNQYGKPDSCVRCHTTGFNSTTREYAYEGVTCEECHGGPKAMRTELSAELCGTCHNGNHRPTFEEWSNSRHSESLGLLRSLGEGKNARCLTCHSAEGFIGNLKRLNWNPEKAANPVNCALCHDSHTVTLRIEPASSLCGRCHEGAGHPQSDLRGKGTHSMMNVFCEQCHMYKKSYDGGSMPAYTGHRFEIVKEGGEPIVCKKCHDGGQGIPSYSFSLEKLKSIQKEYETKDTLVQYLISSAEGSLERAQSTLDRVTTGKVASSTLTSAHGLIDNSRTLLKEASNTRDFLAADGSKGFHNPQEYSERLTEAKEKARHARSLAMAAENMVTVELQGAIAQVEAKMLRSEAATFTLILTFYGVALAMVASVFAFYLIRRHRKGDRS